MDKVISNKLMLINNPIQLSEKEIFEYKSYINGKKTIFYLSFLGIPALTFAFKRNFFVLSIPLGYIVGTFLISKKSYVHNQDIIENLEHTLQHKQEILKSNGIITGKVSDKGVILKSKSMQELFYLDEKNKYV